MRRTILTNMGQMVAGLLLCVLIAAAVAGPAAAESIGSQRELLQNMKSFADCVKKIVGVQAIFKGDQDYERQRKRISNAKFFQSNFPQAIAFPSTSSDAASLIKCATSNGVKVSVRGGGHNYEGLSLVNYGLVIDTGKMTSIKFSKLGNDDVVTVGAGQRIGPVNAQLWNNKKFVPTGVCESVGLVGVTLGGGLGPSLRKVGITADSLVQAAVVTAQGKVLTVNSQTNSDLFFALRGGGGNYAMVTSLTYRLSTPPPKMSILQVSWDNNKDNWRNLLKAFFSWKPYTLPSEYTYVELWLGTAARLVVYYWGPKQDLQKLYGTNPIYNSASGKRLEQLKEMDYGGFLEYMMNPWNNVPLSQLTLDNVIKRAFDNNNGRSSYKASSAFLKSGLDAAAIEKLLTVIWPTNNKGWIQVHPMGGAVSKVGVTDTAFPHRDAQYQLQIYINEYNEGWIQSVQSALSPAATGLQYLNYIDTDTKSPWEKYFGKNAQRLKDIKKKWDPQNVFDAINQR